MLFTETLFLGPLGIPKKKIQLLNIFIQDWLCHLKVFSTGKKTETLKGHLLTVECMMVSTILKV